MITDGQIEAFGREYSIEHISLGMYEDGSVPDWPPVIAEIRVQQAGKGWQVTLEVSRETGEKLGEVEVYVYEQGGNLHAENVVYYGKTGNYTEKISKEGLHGNP